MGIKRDLLNFNPYPGLRPFAAEDSDLFYGRRAECDDVILKLLNSRVVTITGVPGSGKSSLINGGIIPSMMASGIGAGSSWKIIEFRPGKDPFLNLEAAISLLIEKGNNPKVETTSILPELLNSDNFHEALNKFFPGENVLLVIDQLEEIFINYSAIKGASVSRFIDFLVKSTDITDEHLFLITALRSDFVGECIKYKGLARLVNSSTYLLTEPNVENLREIIESPAKASGTDINPDLISTIMGEINDLHYPLHLLQHVMRRTWAHWQDHSSSSSSIGRDNYESVGTIKDSISFHANEIFETLGKRDKLICETMFRTITRKGPDNKGIRNSTDIKTIKAIAGCSTEELIRVADYFRGNSSFFITPSININLNENSALDLSTECIIYSWNRLAGWIEKEDRSKMIYVQLSEASALYHQGKAGLYKSADLHSAINWREENKPDLAWAEQYNPAFERAMVYLKTSEKSYNDEEEGKRKLHRKASGRSILIPVILGLLIFGALGLILPKYMKSSENNDSVSEALRIEALKMKVIADSSQLVSERLLLLQDSTTSTSSDQVQRAIDGQLLAEKQTKIAEYKFKEEIIEKTRAIEERNEAMRLRMLSVGKAMSLKSLQFSGEKDLQSLLAFQAYLFNKKNGGADYDADIYAGLYNIGMLYGTVSFKSFKGHQGDIRSIAFVPGREEFFTSGNDGKVLRWSLSKKNQTIQAVYSGKDIIEVLAVSPDASWLACGSSGSSIRIIPLKSNLENFELSAHKGAVKSLIFSSDGKFLYSAAIDGQVLKWDIAARTSINVATGLREIISIDVSSNGDHLAGISSDGNVVVWDPESTDNFRIETAGRKVRVVKFKPSDNLLAIGYSDGNVELWNVGLKMKISQVKAHNSQVNDISFNTKLTQMATAGSDNRIKVFNIEDPADLSSPPLTLPDNDGFVLEIEFSPDGQMIVSGGSGGENSLKGRPANPDYFAEDIHNMVSRNLTPEEWKAYVGRDIPYEKTYGGRDLDIKIEPITR